MFDVTCVVLKGIRDEKTHTTPNQRGEADGALGNMESFLFVFILHLMKEVLGKTETLNKAIQKKSQDILNAMELVASTKESLQELRNSGWDSFLTKVTFFCNKHRIEVPDWNAPYTSSRYRPRRGDLHFTFEHYYRVDLFTTSLDIQLHELDSRFNEKSVELLSLSCTLMSKEIKINEICTLVEKYYPTDFTEKERIQLGYQLELFNIEMTKNSKMSDVSTLAGACEFLAETKKRENYYLVDRVMRLILTLPVSTATTERGFSAMKIFKNRLRNKMSDDFLANSLMVYIEKDIAESFDSDSIIEEFKNLKGRRAEL